MLDTSSLDGADEARRASLNCEYCGGEGLATIYHADYDGTNPYIIVHDHDERPRKKVTRTTAYCKCAAGVWIMEAHRRDARDIFARMTTVEDVINKGSLWSIDDPTLPPVHSGEVPDWAAFRRQLGTGPPAKVIHVKRDPQESPRPHGDPIIESAKA